MKFLALWLLHVVLLDPLTNHIERLLFRQQVDSALQVIDQNLPAKQDYIYWRLLLSKGEALQKKVNTVQLYPFYIRFIKARILTRTYTLEPAWN